MSDRTKLSTDVQEVDLDYMADFVEDDKSLEGLEEFFVPSILKKLEATSKPKELVDEFGAGSIILTGQNACVWKMGDIPFKFVPIIFVPIVRKWKDLKDQEPPKIVDQTFDMHSEMAKIARSPVKRSAESYGNGYKYQYVQHLTFIGIIYDGPYVGTQCILSFERSGHFKGQSLATAIQSRRITIKDEVKRQPMYTQVWGISLIEQHNQYGNWHGFNFCAVKPNVIDKQHAESFRELNKTWKEKQAKEHIVYEDESTANDVSTSDDDESDGGM